jgi:acylpyruvate hydrolase
LRFVTVEHEGRRLAGALENGRVLPLAGVQELGPSTPRSLLESPVLRRRASVPLEEVRLLPPVPNPGKILCVGLNYKAHVEETNRDLPDYPVLFAKFPSSLIGAADPIELPPESSQVDYEGELGVVIGERARRIPRDRGLEVVAGYTVCNDVTMRDYQYKTHQWIQGKTWDSSTPAGPALVSADEAGDPSRLELEVRLNDQVMQAGSTSQLIFDVATLVNVVSEFTTLNPGDMLLTGTPGGVGYRRDPQVFLADGDLVSVEVSGIGRLENRVIAERVPGASAARL